MAEGVRRGQKAEKWLKALEKRKHWKKVNLARERLRRLIRRRTGRKWLPGAGLAEAWLKAGSPKDLESAAGFARRAESEAKIAASMSRFHEGAPSIGKRAMLAALGRDGELAGSAGNVAPPAPAPPKSGARRVPDVIRQTQEAKRQLQGEEKRCAAVAREAYKNTPEGRMDALIERELLRTRGRLQEEPDSHSWMGA